ncbi:hypothetical protein [Bacillus tuaregi]|uniref:hypothetical protein n=1 Tax=Bacillus tuaregi TaxID=1816695 RepID=UPI0008F8361A|nr:hypothetical protein [Bacillus tuaregi]
MTQIIDYVSNSSEFISIQEDQEELIETGKQKLLEFSHTIPNRVIGGISNFIGLMSNLAIIFVSVPFLLFYTFIYKDR